MKLACAVSALVLLALTHTASAATKTTLASLGPQSYNVNVTGFADGLSTTNCTTDKYGAPCLPQLQADGSSVQIAYSVKPDKTAPTTITSVTLKACYSNSTKVDRPWRKTDPIIDKDKQCTTMIAKGLPGLSGSTSWTPNANTPNGVYFVRAYGICTTPNGTDYCSFGNSMGFFQINQIDSRPTWLVIMVCCFIPIGPIILGIYFGYDKMTRKNK